MFSLIHSGGIDLEAIKKMRRLFYQNIDSDHTGTWRNESVIVSGSDDEFPEPQEIDKKMQELEKWITETRSGFHPVEFAALLHLKIVMIHPL